MKYCAKQFLLARRAYARFLDIQSACIAIESYAKSDIDPGMKFDAIRMRLVEIGEAVKGLSQSERNLAPEVPWRMISGMRNHLAHRYWDTAHPIVMNAAQHEIPALLATVTIVLEKWDQQD